MMNDWEAQLESTVAVIGNGKRELMTENQS